MNIDPKPESADENNKAGRVSGEGVSPQPGEQVFAAGGDGTFDESDEPEDRARRGE